MPFGIRSASEYIEKNRALMLDHRAEFCHGCNKEVRPGEDGRSKLAAAKFSYLSDGETHERRALFCDSCYMRQLKLSFNTLEEFKAHLETKQRLPRTVSKPYKTKSNPKGEKKPVKQKLLKSTSLDSIDREFLVDLHRMLGEYLALGATSDVPADEDDDDLMAGMTEEQRLRMDVAVSIAEERSTQVPQESWINSEVPNGW